MTKNSNQPDPFIAIRESLQAREILGALNLHGAANDKIFYRWLGEIGLGPSHRQLADLLDRLEKEGLITSEQVENFRVIQLTRQGREIAEGREASDWIERPEPRS